MTKEEILDREHTIAAFGNTTLTKISFPTALQEEVYSAMDIWAKQQAIAFARYMFQDVWKMNGMSASPYVSEDQLYNQFIEQQNKS